MILLDSLVVIYSALTEDQFLQKYFEPKTTFVSEISRLESLGFHGITDSERHFFNLIFSRIEIVKVSTEVIDLAIELRAKYKLSLGDSIVASTAVFFDYQLITRNVNDFKKISGLDLFNPFESNL